MQAGDIVKFCNTNDFAIVVHVWCNAQELCCDVFLLKTETLSSGYQNHWQVYEPAPPVFKTLANVKQHDHNMDMKSYV